MADSTDGSVNADDSEFYGPVVGVNLGTIIYGRPPEDAERQRLVAYLEQVTKSHNTLRVVGVGSSHLASGIDLASAYMMLAVQGRQRMLRPLTAEEVEAYQQHRFKIPKELSADRCLPDHAVLAVVEDSQSGQLALFRAELATETVLAHPYLVLCGPPGSGKSTFAKHLVWALAQRGRDQINHHTGLLGWNDHQRVLPVFMSLRTLAGALIGKDLGLTDTPNIGLLLDAVCAHLQTKYGLEQPRELLKAGLKGSLTVLFVFDGLDEVPLEATAASLDRRSLLTFVRLFASAYAARILITCRSRAWTEDYRQITQWPMVELAPLSGGQMTQFINTWFPLLHAKGVIEHEAIARYGAQLMQALRDPQRRRLRDMADNPLLLSMMIFVLARKGVLPRDRHSLYDDILKQLLGEWDTTSRNGQNLGQAVGDDRITGDEVRDQVLDRLCYQAHLTATSADGRGRIPSRELQIALMEYFARVNVADPYRAAERCVAYIDQCSGLLQPEDEGMVYAFAHLTLQEQSAGRHLVFSESLDQLLALRRDDRWREPIFLGVGCLTKARLGSAKIEQLLTTLVDSDAYEAGEMHQYDWYRDLILAAELGADCDWGLLHGKQIKVDRIQRRLRAGLVNLLEDYDHAQAALAYYNGQAMEPAPLLVRERQKGAELLAGLGDARYPVSIEQWQQVTCQLSTQFGREGTHYWRYIPAGCYRVGGWDGDEQATTVELPSYWVGRFMVTVDQYRAFIEAGGYTNDAWWTTQGLAWKKETNRTEPWGWNGQIEQEYRNQPVYGVSGYAAMAYCQWLSEQLTPWLPQGYCIRLASEAEWEVAAAYNADGQRHTYPWGEQPATPEHAVYDWSDERRPLSVGLGLLGQAACGMLDSVGNLWEWAAVRYQDNGGDRQQVLADSNDWMVLRGSLYYNNSTKILCAARDWCRPDDDDVYNCPGFRCFLAPRSYVLHAAS
ncbi:putative signal transduction protein with Nacht domain (plasmid) [Herpetosiphon aurantiacus DSM 785]|uniref:Signal transduction protein with Nacht domain n=1 Tax=Herpetosiphon aurantiacus (strain ATCC 23779 / DSM 785 / 114-95) TaxID=316274 RepID=A9B8T6_HERA2|nr:putative signal transduction protein with Nacht domain [Herpetosiphon aurantiacus DSM 785]